MAKREKRQRQTFPGPNATENQQMLEDIRTTLNNQPSNSTSPTASCDREEYSSETARREDVSRRSPPSEQLAPGQSPRMQNPSRSTPTKQLGSNGTKEKLREIKKSLRPFAYSDPGFHHPSIDKVNKQMLERLICLGYNENSSVSALLACNNASVDAALDVLQQPKETMRKKTHPLSAIHEDPPRSPKTSVTESPRPDDLAPSPSYDTRRYNRRRSPEKACGSPYATRPDGHYESSGIPRISPITLPGFKTPINFAELPPAPKEHAPPQYGYKYETDTHSDSSPTRTSPPYISSSSPESKTHIHVSPPPEVNAVSYSPYSYPIKSASPNVHKPIPAYASRVTPPGSEFWDSGIEEEVAPRRPSVPPEAFKFFIEQHIENVYKAYHQRLQRRLKLEQEMGKRKLDEATSEQMRRILYQKESNFLRIKRAKMHSEMFDIVKPLGIGAFGVVSLVKKTDTSKLYAMKTLRKADVLRRNQVAHVKAERDILAEADNEWVVKLFFSFQDSENLYFVMEYIAGGDMMSLLIKLGTFPEHLTLFYIAELVCAIESVHKMGFIHRDIKPDNILIGADGHIKLTDFGLCTGFRWTHDSKRYLPKGQHQRHHSMEPGQWEDEMPAKPLEVSRLKEGARNRSIAHSLVGTPNYIAPEILRREGYRQLCDWWSVGVIMYEMLIGQPPFMASTPADTQVKIINWSQHLHIPRQATLSSAAADLIVKFCCDPEHRLGKRGVDEIKRHPFFSAIDWSVGIRNYEPPYIPKVMFDTDTSNFDPIPQGQLQKLNKKQQDMSSLPKGHPEHAFYEFTFIRFSAERGREKRPTVTPSSVYGGAYRSHDSDTPSSPSPTSGKDKRSQPVYV